MRYLAAALLATTGLTSAAQAQNQPQPSAEPTDSEIIVTGSRVRGEAPVGSSVVSLGRAELVESGRVTLDRAIKELPQVFDLGVSENSRGQSGGAGNIVYGNSINLRGIGPNATLILIDGHRVTSNSRSIDPSVLPTLGVERVEVVADGASAIYGSDAVAGVVNLIPRRSLDGAEAFARAGVAGDGAYHEYAMGAALGKKWDRGQVMVAFEHVEKSNLDGADRGFFRSNQTAFGGNDYSSTRCAPGTITAGGINYAIPVGGVTQANAGSLVAGTSNRCDDLQGQDLIPQQAYNSVNATFSFDLTDWLTVFADAFYSKRTFRRNPAYVNAALTVPQTNAFFVRPAGFTGTSYTVNYNLSADLPRNVSFGHGESWQVTPGIRVKLPHDFQFEALIGKGRTDDNSSSLFGVNNTALTAALASATAATAFDPYGLNRTSAATISGIYNQISINPTIGNFTGYEARLNGPLFRLPGGEVKVAVGYEGQEFSVDLGIARGNPGTTVVFTTRGRRVDSLYAELLVPLFGSENEVPGFRKLDLNAAVRQDRYSDVGKTVNPKFGVNWSPVQGLMFRGSYGTSFRAPTLPQIYGNTNQLFVQNYQNPAGGAPIVGVARSGGNLGLNPESATTWSVGADIEPVRDLRLSLTYFNVDYRNQVVALLSDLAVLTRASQYDGTGLIVQGAAAGQAVAALVAQGLAVSGTFPGGNPLNVTVYVDGRSQNLASSVTRGIDFQANYTLRTENSGTFGFNLSGTYLTAYNTAQTPTAPVISQLNQIFQPLQFKARASINWEQGPFGVMLRATHLNGYTNTAVTPNQSVKSYTPIDLNLTWKIGDRATPFVFGVEVRNLFNIAPPYVNIAPSVNGSGGYDASAADPIGRLFAVSVRKTF
ncbi:TonB-dependent siderophore receptor [Sphingomonas sp. SUN039]|uniref:TonB-dependent receptor plug domain-containing protein n=1 Tax=Sphingomonas sp. SUN039 TaxID=2937787 RepID=UPI0021640ABF|nr:TonB-dependent receptor [Sphingomonas sp. SUN039]UVO54381.1 TonB-dependent receptor [Sphingomonas sp. SUN039]